MNDVRAAWPVRPNLWADRLTAYAFGVEAAIGQNPMRYLLARRFDRMPPTSALTMLFVMEPRVLFGTYVRIDETDGTCRVRTYLPTMARPVEVAEASMFDCLPLTDVGYLDLMAWPHPGLRALPAADAGPAGRTRTRTLHYAGPASVPTLRVREVLDIELSMVVERVFYRDERQVRRWEIVERGGPRQETLPVRIRVCRPATGHETEFLRSGPPISVPPAVFDAEPVRLRDWIEHRLMRAEAP
jgi:hypothetical protein